MKKLVFILSLVALVSCNPASPDAAKFLAAGHWIDLTWDFDQHTVYWPTNITFKHDTVFYGFNDKGYFYASFKYSAEEHGGTHFDAPLHFAQGGRSVEQITTDELTGQAIVLDVTAQSVKNRDYLVTTHDFLQWEKEWGEIPDKAIVLLHTGFGRFWGDPEKYSGTLKSGVAGVAELHFPGLDPEAADWLARERNIKSVGIDTPSIDYGQSTDFRTHRSLCGNNITAYENIANLEQLPPKGAYLVAAPMKIKGGSGSPLRLLAWVPGS
jgi:kynurenine formamidase